MPTTDELIGINPGDKITATWLNRIILEVNLLRRQVETLQRSHVTENLSALAPAHVRISSAADTSGVYLGFAARAPFVAPNETADLEADGVLGTFPEYEDTLIININELGQGTHALTASGNIADEFIGRYIGTNGDGYFVVLIDGVARMVGCSTS